MSYFNYYIHTINEQIVRIYFTTYNRYTLTVELSLCLHEALLTGRKELALTNPNPSNNQVYLMDAVNFLSEANKQEIQFIKVASKRVFGDYIDIIERTDKNFCEVSDSYNASQTIPCDKYYAGPKNQGIYSASAYAIEYFTQYSNKIQNTDLTNLTIRMQMLTDPQTAIIGIFYAKFMS